MARAAQAVQCTTLCIALARPGPQLADATPDRIQPIQPAHKSSTICTPCHTKAFTSASQPTQDCAPDAKHHQLCCSRQATARPLIDCRYCCQQTTAQFTHPKPGDPSAHMQLAAAAVVDYDLWPTAAYSLCLRATGPGVGRPLGPNTARGLLLTAIASCC
jgi:hypothetical protein